MPSKCEYYHKLKQRNVNPSDAKKWLKRNPTPKGWKHSAWRWAYENMGV